ncbi:MAG: citrate transporter [Ignavibacteriales bacterium]|nr:citrate transporter [Ignavibacteriales bacterium]
MEIFQIILLISVFVFMALMMFFRKIPALIALPLMAVLIAIIGNINFTDIIEYVIGQGSLKLHQAYTIALFGSMLSVLMQKTGVAEAFIKKGAELSGDNPWLIAIILLLLIISLFTTLGGLGAIIMVATIVLPIMSSVGIGPMTSVGIFLFGLSIGGILNVGNWAVYISVMGLTVDEIRPFAMLMFLVSILGAIVYITIQIYRDGHDLNFKKIIFRSLIIIFALTLIYYLYTSLTSYESKIQFTEILSNVGIALKWIIAICIALLFITAFIRIILRKNENAVQPHWISFLSPILPLFLILLFDVNFIAAFIVGLLYAFLTTYKKGRLNLFIQACFEGGGVVMPAVVLMFGIGMLLVAIMGPGVTLDQYPDGWPVLNIVKPLMAQIIPSNPISYILIFSAAAPLALYRGPLNVWGMGYGLAAVFLASGLNPGAVMGLLIAVGQIQGISDPTNTHNVWLANEMRVDVQKVLWNTIIYTWLMAIVGLIISSIMFM